MSRRSFRVAMAAAFAQVASGLMLLAIFGLWHARVSRLFVLVILVVLLLEAVSWIFAVRSQRLLQHENELLKKSAQLREKEWLS